MPNSEKFTRSETKRGDSWGRCVTLNFLQPRAETRLKPCQRAGAVEAHVRSFRASAWFGLSVSTVPSRLRAVA